MRSELYLADTFGLTYNDLYRDIATIKEWSLERIQCQLYSDGLFYGIADAMNYSQNMLTPESKRKFEKFCFESWGLFNRDLLRCILSLSALESILTTNFFTYKLHYDIAQDLHGSPINNRNEWTPMKRELGTSVVRASEDYLFTCAVHRNDKLSQLISLDAEEIRNFRTGKNCEEFRAFFHNATSMLVLPYTQPDEIAKEVFIKVDEMLNKYQTLSEDAKKQLERELYLDWQRPEWG